MHVKKYKSHEQYVEAQRRTDAKKRKMGSCVIREEVTQMAAWLGQSNTQVNRIMCHGARHGFELDWFSEEFPEAEVVGTDLFDKKHPGIVLCDFHERKPEWIGAFDLVYSNALDHSHDPQLALSVWFDQLAADGKLILQWSNSHRECAMRGGDCFGAEFHEYLDLMNTAGRVVGLLYRGKQRRLRYSRVVNIVAKNENIIAKNE